LFIKTDVTKRADIEALVNGTVAEFGKLDCAVNNAGIEETQKGFLRPASP